jgi:hypothetical protein
MYIVENHIAVRDRVGARRLPPSSIRSIGGRNTYTTTPPPSPAEF